MQLDPQPFAFTFPFPSVEQKKSLVDHFTLHLSKRNFNMLAASILITALSLASGMVEGRMDRRSKDSSMARRALPAGVGKRLPILQEKPA